MPITAEDLANPPYWLVYGLPWPEDAAPDAMPEAAFAFAPLVTGPLRRAAKDVVYVADVYHREFGGRVVFFSDLTRFGVLLTDRAPAAKTWVCILTCTKLRPLLVGTRSSADGALRVAESMSTNSQFAALASRV